MPGDFPRHLFMVGCGNMGGAMLSRWLSQGLDADRVTVLRPSGASVGPGVMVVTEAPTELPAGSIVILAMKPQQWSTVAPAVGPLVRQSVATLSLLAGVPLAVLQDGVPGFGGFVRAMPNTPVAIGQGVTALYADSDFPADQRSGIDALIAPLGSAEWLADEDQFNLFTALGGCGPAYVFRFIDALARAAESLGMDETQARRVALATVRGASSLAAASDETPGALADRVASPGGMTREGLDVLDADSALAGLLTDTLRAARDRGEELARLAANAG
nr:pyrroline-5-carboxylate reductase [Sphingobium subterraneum]